MTSAKKNPGKKHLFRLERTGANDSAKDSALLRSQKDGRDDQAKKKGRYKVGEGITGKVVEAGEPIAVPNIGEEPLFLNRTGARKDFLRNRIAFICVPIKIDQETIGALSVDRLFEGNVSLDEDLRLLTIISSILAQTVASVEPVSGQESPSTAPS